MGPKNNTAPTKTKQKEQEKKSQRKWQEKQNRLHSREIKFYMILENSNLKPFSAKTKIYKQSLI